MIKTKRAIVIFVFCSIYLFVFPSCKSKYLLRNANAVSEQIIEDLKTKKIVFIGENHNDVYPVIFMTEHMEEFYDAGVRYLFLEEESDNYLNNPEEFRFAIYPPWMQFAYKYEYLNFEKEIERINNLNKNDPIIVIWGETGLEITQNDMDAGLRVLNMRDNFAQKNIIETMDKEPNKKGLVFYGAAHGLKEPVVWDFETENEKWKPIGSYLNEHYGSDFSTYIFVQFKFCNTLKEYDYYCIYSKKVFGVPYFYVPEKNVLMFLISTLKEKAVEKKRSSVITIGKNAVFGFDIPLTEVTQVHSTKSMQILSVYYLKYYLGDEFDYNYKEPSSKLHAALAKLDNYDYRKNTYNLIDLENYMKFLYAYGFIEDYLYYPSKDKRIGYILHNMKKAKSINSHDIWPQYWISYFETEKAKYSGKKNDYKKALAEWNKLLENDLLYASPVLKLTYQKISMCEEKLGNTEKSQYYRQKESEVNMLYEIDYEKYVYFGY